MATQPSHLDRLLALLDPLLLGSPSFVVESHHHPGYRQIGKSKMIAARYVLRAYDGSPVATPLAWAEVIPGLHPKQFHIHNARERFLQKGALFRRVLERPQNLYEALGRLEKVFR